MTVIWTPGSSGKLKLVKDTVPDIIRTNLTLNLDPNDTPSSSGSTLYDLTGTSNATLENAPTHNSDIGYYDYDGVNQHLSRSEPIISGTNDLTFEIWFNIDTISGSWGSGYTAARIFYHPFFRGAMFYIVSFNGQPWLLLFKENGTSFGPTWNVQNTIVNGSWYQLVLTQDSTNSAQVVYINGTQAYTASETRSWGTPSGDMYFLMNPLGPDGAFNGKVGEIRAYNSVLTASEVSNNWEARRWRYGL